MNIDFINDSRFRFLIVECDDQDSQTKDQRILQMYLTVLKRFSQALNSVSLWQIMI